MAVGGALFSGGGRAAATSKALVEFRAGKMNLTGTTVTPDKRKGMVMVEQGDDDLMHFKWKDRTSGNVEDDLIIFPDDIEFKRVAQCTTGRVFILKFKSSSRKLFFWMQEPKEDKDEEFCKKINDFLNNPPAAGSTGSGRSSAGNALAAAASGLDMSNLRDSELQSLLNHMSQQQLMQLFGDSSIMSPTSGSTRQRSSARAVTDATRTPAAATPAAATTAATPIATPAAATPVAATVAGANPAIQLSDLRSILSGIRVPPGASGASGPEVDLSAGLNVEVLQPLLENPEFVKKMKDLLPQIPGEESTEDTVSEIKGTVLSPQFKQALGLFSSGLQTGQLAPLVREFALGEEAVKAATDGDMEAFVKALQKANSEKKSEPKGDEEMDLD